MTRVLLYVVALLFPFCMQGKQLEHRTEVDGIYYAISGHYHGISVTNVSDERIAADKGHVIVPDGIYYERNWYGVTDIEQEAFAGKSGLRSVTLPGCVLSIHDAAFAGCENLEKVKLNEGLRWIYATSFAGCTKLRQITIPSSVEFIGKHAFQGCSSLSSVVFYGNVKMGKEVFDDCQSLKESDIRTEKPKPALQSTPKNIARQVKKQEPAAETKSEPAKQIRRRSSLLTSVLKKYYMKVKEHYMMFGRILFLVEIILAFLAFGFRRDETKYMEYPVNVFHNIWKEMFIVLNIFPVLCVAVAIIVSAIYADQNRLTGILPSMVGGTVVGGGILLLFYVPRLIMQKLLHIPFLTITEKYIRKRTLFDSDCIYYENVADVRLDNSYYVWLTKQSSGPYVKHVFLIIRYKSGKKKTICLNGLEMKPQEIYDMVQYYLVK